MKPWADEIKDHIDTWSSKLGRLGWWPRYVYHFTDVCNAASVIRTGHVYSRAEADRLGLMQVDNASPQIMAQTRPEHLGYVRLYFRPRTPTQYRNEGIRPEGQRELGGAHCPIPVYFCFDAFSVLADDDTEFSDGNMASPEALHGGDRDFFLRIPFQYVFHHGAFPDQARSTIVYHRNAEVLVPERLPLDRALKFIACRSVAERQTLFHLLPQGIRHQWAPRIRLGEQGLFERRWTFAEEVVVVGESVVFRFNPNTRTPGPFDVAFTYVEADQPPPRTWQDHVQALDNQLRIKVPGATWGTVTLRLHDALAFAGTLFFEEIPF